ncbi:large tegument protein [Streptomyces laurentii]|uniref:Large tegument protein n=1 Tax=Streptomyces laurentii TaxID=39478 RepID=A0A160P681_STRLU|nr:large tegument protein [Streptomyces laurentii]
MSVTPSTSVRRAVRGPAALAVLIAAAALPGAPAAQAAARVPVHQCWVNDVPAPPGDQVNGTPGDDHIFCDSDLENVTVSGGEGNDLIEIKGLVIDSVVQGGDGDDIIRAKHLVPQNGSSMVRGNRGNDIITVATVHGNGAEHGAVVHGDDGDDTITTGSVYGAPGQYNRGGGLVTGNDGADHITTGVIDFSGRVLGGSENDTIEAAGVGPESGGLIQAGPGDDTISGLNGEILIVGEHWGTVDAGIGKDTCAVKSVSTRTSISSCEILKEGSVVERPPGKPQSPAPMTPKPAPATPDTTTPKPGPAASTPEVTGPAASTPEVTDPTAADPTAPRPEVQPGAQPGVQQGAQPVVLPGVQPGVQPGAPSVVQPGARPGVQPVNARPAGKPAVEPGARSDGS